MKVLPYPSGERGYSLFHESRKMGTTYYYGADCQDFYASGIESPIITARIGG